MEVNYRLTTGKRKRENPDRVWNYSNFCTRAVAPLHHIKNDTALHHTFNKKLKGNNSRYYTILTQ